MLISHFVIDPGFVHYWLQYDWKLLERRGRKARGDAIMPSFDCNEWAEA